MPKLSFKPIAMSVSAAVLPAACTVPFVESAHFGPPALLHSRIAEFYRRHGREEDGLCIRPFIDAITKVDIVEDTPERLVVDIRYRYRDRVRDGGPSGNLTQCVGFSSRTFTLTPSDGDPVVAEMSGTDCAGSPFLLTRALGIENDTRTCP